MGKGLFSWIWCISVILSGGLVTFFNIYLAASAFKIFPEPYHEVARSCFDKDLESCNDSHPFSSMVHAPDLNCAGAFLASGAVILTVACGIVAIPCRKKDVDLVYLYILTCLAILSCFSSVIISSIVAGCILRIVGTLDMLDANETIGISSSLLISSLILIICSTRFHILTRKTVEKNTCLIPHLDAMLIYPQTASTSIPTTPLCSSSSRFEEIERADILKATFVMEERKECNQGIAVLTNTGKTGGLLLNPLDIVPSNSNRKYFSPLTLPSNHHALAGGGHDLGIRNNPMTIRELYEQDEELMREASKGNGATMGVKFTRAPSPEMIEHALLNNYHHQQQSLQASTQNNKILQDKNSVVGKNASTLKYPLNKKNFKPKVYTSPLIPIHLPIIQNNGRNNDNASPPKNSSPFSNLLGDPMLASNLRDSSDEQHKHVHEHSKYKNNNNNNHLFMSNRTTEYPSSITTNLPTPDASPFSTVDFAHAIDDDSSSDKIINFDKNESVAHQRTIKERDHSQYSNSEERNFHEYDQSPLSNSVYASENPLLFTNTPYASNTMASTKSVQKSKNYNSNNNLLISIDQENDVSSSSPAQIHNNNKNNNSSLIQLSKNNDMNALNDNYFSDEIQMNNKESLNTKNDKVSGDANLLLHERQLYSSLGSSSGYNKGFAVTVREQIRSLASK